MRRCPVCAVDVEGAWTRCPLCAAPLAGEPAPSPLPAVPLRFSRRRVLRALFLASLAVILASLGAQLLFGPDLGGLGVLRSAWLGVAALWLVVLMAVRKRRNLAKGTVYLVVLVGLVTAYWDYLGGWDGWSLTYAVPILCASSIVALLITVRVMRTEIGEHILYSGLTVLLGLAPLVFLALGWVTAALPSVICGALSVVALGMHLARIRHVRHELAKRLHV
ncbi:hypothetical protein E7744_02225 [Citricoccus sp. SGAir0253]|uniref:DUF6320 domain-containing protein n=1 Tax=Citricoccus sp. SGAir0253 TaxID=2567881 RepID=UPI0010CD449D|nr:DUF6320 domain-containing protein [Citricoccus sp. SGAir0253]QCU77164.1 hypothetical protein E7744_02225 [Citricoccus sp. SGAir0253]